MIDPAFTTGTEVVMDGSTLYDVVMRGAGEYIYTDVKAEELKCLLNYGYEEEMNTISGKMQAGPDHDEFYPDESKLYEIVLKLFYKSIDK